MSQDAHVRLKGYCCYEYRVVTRDTMTRWPDCRGAGGGKEREGGRRGLDHAEMFALRKQALCLKQLK